MRIVFCPFIIYIIYILHGCFTKKVLKPSFFPYCTTRDRCKPACTCEVYPNCMLLTMDESIRSSILFYHNQIRDIQSGAEPQPAGMTLLQYDMELEEISVCWAARCDDEYSECFITSRFSETSQSVIQLVLGEGQQPNVFLWMQVMNEWLGQVRTLSVETIMNLPAGEEGEKLHNYVQLMSDRTLAIGCAWSLLNNVLTLVCTYGPRGPLQGEAVYKTGYPCSLCPGGYACDYVKPFEQLCKLRIYSAVSTTQEVPQFETPPPPPPLPRLPESADSQYNLPSQFGAPPPPPMIPENNNLANPPPYPQQAQTVLPQPPTPPGVTGLFPSETVGPITESTTFGLPKKKSGLSGSVIHQLQVLSLLPLCLVLKFVVL